MNKEQQDLAWACLPKEVRDYIRKDYNDFCRRYKENNSNLSRGAIDTLEDLFGKHNLTSNVLYVNGYLSDAMKTSVSATQEELKSAASDKGVSEIADEIVKKSIAPVIEHFNIDKIQPFNIGDKVIVNGKFVSEIKDIDIKGYPDYPYIIPKENGKMGYFAESDIELYTEQAKPKYRKGDAVLFMPTQVVYDVEEYLPDLKVYKLSRMSGTITTFAHEIQLEPYIENTNDMEIMEEGLNLSQLLKGCEREMFYSPIHGSITLITPSNGGTETLAFQIGNSGAFVTYTKQGYYDIRHEDDAMINLYPSRALYEKYPLDAQKAWAEWIEDRKPKCYVEVHVGFLNGCDEVACEISPISEEKAVQITEKIKQILTQEEEVKQ